MNLKQSNSHNTDVSGQFIKVCGLVSNDNLISRATDLNIFVSLKIQRFTVGFQFGVIDSLVFKHINYSTITTINVMSFTYFDDNITEFKSKRQKFNDYVHTWCKPLPQICAVDWSMRTRWKTPVIMNVHVLHVISDRNPLGHSFLTGRRIGRAPVEVVSDAMNPAAHVCTAQWRIQKFKMGGGSAFGSSPLPSPPLSLWRASASLEKFFWTKDARRCVLSAFSTQK